MIKFLRKIVELKLNFAAKILLWRKKPEVIAITGSAGKTTTKEIVRHLLSSDFEVLASGEGYNTELGAPLMLFSLSVPSSTFSVISWAKIILKAYKTAFFAREYPEKVVVEMGADTPGDIERLTKLVRPEKAIVLTVLPVHTENFVDLAGVSEEKGKLAKGVKKGGTVFLNIDDENVRKMKTEPGVRKVYFGKGEGADIQVKGIEVDLTGLKLTIKEGSEKVTLSARLYGEHMIYPLLAGVALARSEHISFKKIKESLRTLAPFKGRMNVLEGKNNSIIIDDSYNANPVSVIRALEFLSTQKGR
ncbi:MAG: UDP-N-acetylmuramoyl-tripeptide--D-alanyl-D-alanine ligase, partial [Patescibacteria group bacterium]|nr:UDP-N-acetylmuramoyl-tripeptide--D-alanyl-D-alanine ligase [Patescibacteria group bacterium]